ncbi:hypothetical protein Fot_03125 [Forsythia ovata]|uniref:Uncharacterized protein n=1 Tax=Forsythia ovata TaxID=205694 RepID=A0ABD1X8T5_9LAMI
MPPEEFPNSNEYFSPLLRCLKQALSCPRGPLRIAHLVHKVSPQVASPLGEKHGGDWLNAHQACLLYNRCGDITQVIPIDVFWPRNHNFHNLCSQPPNDALFDP